MASFLIHPRSLWPQIIALTLMLSGFAIFAYIFTYMGTMTSTNDGMTFVIDRLNALWVIGFLLMTTGVMFAATMFVRTWLYTKKHPKYTMRALMYAELRDDDEGLSAMTAKATRAAYLQSQRSFMVLIFLFALYIVPTNPFWVVIALSVGLLSVFFTYAWHMRHVELED